jgi:predicted transcriptional regulator of viral defense system
MGAPETSLSHLASVQHGVVTRGDLASLGFGRRQIERRAADGRLVRVHQGVYAVGHAALSREGRWMAAVLACGEGAVLSHRSAAVCWGCADREDLVPHVTARTVCARRGSWRTAGVSRRRT